MKVFGIDIKSERSQRQIGYLALAVGLIAVAGGVLGIWMQGRTMYEGTSLHMIADIFCPEDIYLSICLAPLVTSLGILFLSWVILASKLTGNFSTTKKNALFTAFGIVCLAAIMVVSKIATGQDWARAKLAADEYFKSQQTNAPTSSVAKPQKAHQ